MNWLRDMPVKRKLTLVVASACSVALLLACSLLAVYQMFDFKRAMARDLTIVADVLAQNTRAPLASEDPEAARKILLTLQSEPAVEGACLFDTTGARFSEYVRTGTAASLPDRPASDGHRFAKGRLVLVRPVLLNEKRIGTIYLEANLRALWERLFLFAAILAVVLPGSVALASLLSLRLQRVISGPILALTETAKAVANEKDFAVRAPEQGRNEMGVLTQAFNQMLGGIEERERALQGEIAERKSAEHRVQAQLAGLELLNQITRAIGERLDLDGIFGVALKNLEDHLPVDFTAVALYEAGENELADFSLGAGSHRLGGALGLDEKARLKIDANGLTRCVRGQLVYEPDTAKVNAPLPERFARCGLPSLVLAPLLVESKVFGVLIAARNQAHAFSSSECEFIRQLSQHVALAAHQSQLYTELQQAYDDLRLSQQSAMQQERLRALGQMASGIAHDINNAISPAGLYLEALLEDEPNLTPRAREYLTTVQRAIHDVAQTVARMGEFYRPREPQLQLAPVNLNNVLQQVLALTRARWNDIPQERGVMIMTQLELAPELPPLMAVESEIREALINLVFNAADAMPDGGILTLRSRIKSESGAPPEIVIEVADTGIGMDDETRRHCLEPFFTTKGERGTGLGLAMVYGIVQRHGAGMEIESAPGKGTTMRILFPLSEVKPESGPVPATQPAIPSRQRILIVDDDPMLIKSVRDCLEGDGHRVVAAQGGQAGIDAFQSAHEQKEPFNVVITDLGMPYVDGRHVAAAVKSRSPSTPVILLTGWGQRMASDGDIPANIDCLLSKPPRRRDLRQAIADLCSVRKPRQD